MNRRTFLLLPCDVIRGIRAQVRYPAVERGVLLAFPRDHGSHPAFRTEWWYITGWVRDGKGRDYGIQVTFAARDPASVKAARVRSRRPASVRTRGRRRPRIWAAAPRPARGAAGFGLAQASEQTTDVAIGDWRLRLRRHVHDTGDRARIRVLARVSRRTAALARRAGRLLQRPERSAGELLLQPPSPRGEGPS